jgi:hypothetical protein
VEAAGVQEIGDAAVREGPPQLLRRVHLQLTLAASPSPASPAASFRAIAAGRVGDASGHSASFGARGSGRTGRVEWSGFQEQEGRVPETERAPHRDQPARDAWSHH